MKDAAVTTTTKKLFRSISVGNLGKKMEEVGGGLGSAPAWWGFLFVFLGLFPEIFQVH